MIREPAFAGPDNFYPSSPSQLREMIKATVDERAVKEEVIGLVLPHAGYIYSGPVVGAVLSKVKIRETAVILCPSHKGYGKLFSVMAEGAWNTPLGKVEIDTELAKRILADSRYLEDDEIAHRFEHAIEVQLPFLQYFKPDVKLVPIVLGHGNIGAYKEIGREIAAAITATKRDALIIASSDMTHYETQESVSNKDAQAIQAILELDEDELLKRVEKYGISMCGYGPAISLISAAKELGAGKAELVKYQTSGDTSGDYSRGVVGYAGISIMRMTPLVKLARDTVEMYIREGKLPEVENLTPEMTGQAGVFVSIHKHGALRGCIGTFEPQRPNIAQEVITNAISSATQDPRFSPISKHELKDLDYSVDVLTSPVPVEDKSKLDPRKYGVIVECGWRRGLLLPDLEGVDTVEHQIDICRQKAGIMSNEPIKLYRFEVKRYK
jgi:AmmeMemoRadiSam system protein B/AmmeMemoRadiSam system protein A